MATSTTSLYNPANPDAFLNNFNNASVLYSQDTPQSQQRATDLQAAYQYLSSPQGRAAEDQANYPGYTDFMLSQLQADIQEQQNLIAYQQAQQATNKGTSEWTGFQDTLNKISGSGGENSLDANQWNQVAKALDQAGEPQVAKAVRGAAQMNNAVGNTLLGGIQAWLG